MAISAIQNQVLASGASSGSQSAELGQSEFLSLLIAQLKAQDPLNPMNGTEFTAQLAQFTSLEQLKDINDSLTNMTASQYEAISTQSVNFLGKTIRAAGNSVYLEQDKASELNFSLNGPAKTVYISIYDAYNRYVTTIEAQNLGAGEHNIVWDGKGVSGKALPAGIYSFEISAVDVNNSIISGKTAISGKVTSIVYKNGMPYLMVGDIAVPIGAVEKVTGV